MNDKNSYQNLTSSDSWNTCHDLDSCREYISNDILTSIFDYLYLHHFYFTRKLTMNLPSLLKKIFPDQIFIATGSRAYGETDQNSDYDFAINVSQQKRILNCLKEWELEYRTSKYFDCIKFDILNAEINIIFLNDVNLHAWQLATLAMKAIYENEKVSGHSHFSKKKFARCNLFSNMVKNFGGDSPTIVFYETEQT